MLKSERKNLIMAKIHDQNFVTLDSLVSLLQTSESTVRRDLDELEAERKLHRIHGGAEKLHSLQEELSVQQKSIKNVQEKRLIAHKAQSLIDENEVIFIEAGTTNELLVDELTRTDITVVTNSPHHAIKLADKKIPTIIIGGELKWATDANIGPIAFNQISQFNFDKAFLGTNGIDNENLTTPDIYEATIKQAVIASSEETFVLTDSTKLDQIAFAKFAKLSDVTVIINQSSKAIVDTLKEKTKVIEV
ncbi:DeoR/GlpR family DNA-binding transcription regulator [Streptococcus dentasini]